MQRLKKNRYKILSLKTFAGTKILTTITVKHTTIGKTR